MTNFDKLVKLAGNEYSSKVSDGLETDVTSYIDTGSYSFNALLSGSIYNGLPGNKTTALAGEPSTGKSFFALSIAKYFMDTNKKGGVVYFESEGAITSEMLTGRNINTDRLYVVPVVTIQEFRTQCIKMVEGYLETPKDEREPLLMIVDSLGNLSTTKEVEDVSDGKDTRDMTRAQLIRGTFRVLQLKLSRASIPLLVTNHTYAAVGSYVPTKIMSGGDGLQYAASTIVFLSKSKVRDKSSDDNEVVGAKIKAVVKKSRLTVENKEIETLLDYQTGLDRYYGLLDMGIKFGVITKLSKQVEFPDGTKAFESSVNKNPAKYFTKEVLDKIDEGCKKEFLYGSTNALVESADA